MTELAAAQHQVGVVRVDTVAIDSAHRDKFSRHLLLVMSTEHGELVLLRGPREAGAFAARVAKRVGRAALVIDCSVYAPGRCYRLVGSSKLSGAHVHEIAGLAKLSGGRFGTGKHRRDTLRDVQRDLTDGLDGESSPIRRRVAEMISPARGADLVDEDEEDLSVPVPIVLPIDPVPGRFTVTFAEGAPADAPARIVEQVGVPAQGAPGARQR
jgi:hypothetical protein